MRLNSTTNELIFKVVYTGPGMAGKTTNLAHLQRIAPPEAVGEMVSIDTTSERTLHFDLLPLDLGEVRGHSVRFEFYTVPGQTYYAATRRMVLEGADGIVFVADSRREAMDENIESLNDLYSNLRYHGINPDAIPMVFQFNKQDLSEAIPPEQLGPLLNHSNRPAFPAAAKDGTGVVDTMRAIAKQVVESIKDFESIPEVTEVTMTNHKAIGTQDLTDASSSALVDPESWLLTCCHCANILEVPSAKRGDLFTCGACSNRFVVQDPDRGITAPLPGTQLGTAALPDPAITSPAPTPTHTNQQQKTVNAANAHKPPGKATAPLNTGQPGKSSSSRRKSAADLGVEGAKVISVISQDALAVHYRLRLPDGKVCRAMVPHPEVVETKSFALALEPSLKALQRQTLPHAPRFLDRFAGKDGPVLCFAEAPHTEALGSVLTRIRMLAPRQAFQLAANIADACERAATAGFLHGWLRPDAILVNQQQQTTVFGFGLPTLHGYLLDEAMANSPAAEHYVAPELLVRPNEWSPQGDMFLLGALLYRLVTGQPLLTGYNGRQALEAFISGNGAHPRANAPQLTQAQETVIRRLTAVDPVTRYATWNDARQALLATIRQNNGERQPRRNATARAGRTATNRAGSSHKRSKNSNLPMLLVALALVIAAVVIVMQMTSDEPQSSPLPVPGTEAPEKPQATPAQQPETVPDALAAAQAAVAAAEADPTNDSLRDGAHARIAQLPIHQHNQAEALRLRLETSRVEAPNEPLEEAPPEATPVVASTFPAEVPASLQQDLQEERFRQAIDRAGDELQLDIQKDTLKTVEATINEAHQQARQSLEKQLSSLPIDQRQPALQEAINKWNMSTDGTWAIMVLERLEQVPSPVTPDAQQNPTETPAVKPQTEVRPSPATTKTIAAPLTAFTNSGSWVTDNGTISNQGDGSIERHDVGTYKVSSIHLQSDSQAGQLRIFFRGVRAICDLSKQEISFRAGTNRQAPQAISLTDTTVITFAVAGEGQVKGASVQVNGETKAEFATIPMGNGTLALSTDGEAKVRLSNIELRR
jgi:signal recognition particle receptor subunit beta